MLLRYYSTGAADVLDTRIYTLQGVEVLAALNQNWHKIQMTLTSFQLCTCTPLSAQWKEIGVGSTGTDRCVLYFTTFDQH